MHENVAFGANTFFAPRAALSFGTKGILITKGSMGTWVRGDHFGERHSGKIPASTLMKGHVKSSDVQKTCVRAERSWVLTLTVFCLLSLKQNRANENLLSRICLP